MIVAAVLVVAILYSIGVFAVLCAGTHLSCVLVRDRDYVLAVVIELMALAVIAQWVCMLMIYIGR